MTSADTMTAFADRVLDVHLSCVESAMRRRTIDHLGEIGVRIAALAMAAPQGRRRRGKAPSRSAKRRATRRRVECISAIEAHTAAVVAWRGVGTVVDALRRGAR